jgi:hypothetical protein
LATRKKQGLFFDYCFGGANFCTYAALGTCVRIDYIFAIAFADSAGSALVQTRTAADAVVGDHIHGENPPLLNFRNTISKKDLKGK